MRNEKFELNGNSKAPSQFTKMINRVFPHLSIEVALSVVIVSVVLFSIGMTKTVTIGQEMLLMRVEPRDDFVTSEEPEPTKQAEFEVAGEYVVYDTQTVEYQTSQMCFIGDSRTVGMQTAALTDAKFIAKGSMGLVWFNSTASMEFNKIHEDVALCAVLLGINDMSNIDRYIVSLNEFAEKYPDKTFVCVNLGPVDQAKYKSISNKSIEEFNNKMLFGLSDRWQIVDLYAHLSEEGFYSDDGLHYSVQDSAKIFYWIVDEVKTQTIMVKN